MRKKNLSLHLVTEKGSRTTGRNFSDGLSDFRLRYFQVLLPAVAEFSDPSSGG